MYQWGKNYHIYYHAVIFTDNHFTCTALYDGLHKLNYFIYVAIMNILCFFLKTQFEISVTIFFDGLKCIHNIGFESSLIDIWWHSCSRTQKNTSSTILTWEKYIHYQCWALSRYFIVISFLLSFNALKNFPLVVDLSVSRYFCSKISDSW